ncbi:MAG: hypothetical protein R6W70_10910 [bacterium]
MKSNGVSNVFLTVFIFYLSTFVVISCGPAETVINEYSSRHFSKTDNDNQNKNIPEEDAEIYETDLFPEDSEQDSFSDYDTDDLFSDEDNTKFSSIVYNAEAEENVISPEYNITGSATVISDKMIMTEFKNPSKPGSEPTASLINIQYTAENFDLLVVTFQEKTMEECKEFPCDIEIGGASGNSIVCTTETDTFPPETIIIGTLSGVITVKSYIRTEISDLISGIRILEKLHFRSDSLLFNKWDPIPLYNSERGQNQN